ncbi:hypothetical protein T492DRAFT_940132, partial [Pavlovales sp. CCMP2436]
TGGAQRLAARVRTSTFRVLMSTRAISERWRLKHSKHSKHSIPSEDVGTRTAHVLASLQLPERPLLAIDDDGDPHVPTGGAGLGGGLGGGDGGLGGRGGGRQTTAIAEPAPRMASSTLPTMVSAAFRSMADRRRTVAASPSDPSQSHSIPSEDVGTRTVHVLASLQLPERPSLAIDESDPHVPTGSAGLGGGLGGGDGGLGGRTANSDVTRSSTPVPTTVRVALAAPAWTASDRIVYEPPRALPAPEQSDTPVAGRAGRTGARQARPHPAGGVRARARASPAEAHEAGGVAGGGREHGGASAGEEREELGERHVGARAAAAEQLEAPESTSHRPN